MASLSSHANVYNTCLIILRQRGYDLWVEGEIDSEGCIDPLSLAWMAEKEGFDFQGDNPIELLGLTALFEFHQPTGSAVSYWWSIEGPDIYAELLDKAFDNPLGKR